MLKITATGPEPYELQIDRIRFLERLTEAERKIVVAIFLHGHDAALRSGDQGKAAV
jgi:hypothetical protein